MPYRMIVDVPELDLKLGDELDYEQGNLPARHKFTAKWEEEKAKPKRQKKDAE